MSRALLAWGSLPSSAADATESDLAGIGVPWSWSSARKRPRWARDGGNGSAGIFAGMDTPVELLIRQIQPTWTIDVETADGWRRVELTRDQVLKLSRQLVECVLPSEA